jgi:hypothetical protein
LAVQPGEQASDTRSDLLVQKKGRFATTRPAQTTSRETPMYPCKPQRTSCKTGAFAREAHRLIDVGLAPIPLDGKAPLVTGFQSWLRPPSRSTVDRWVERFGDKNVGIVTGKASNITVIDYDGANAIDNALSGNDAAIVVETPSGGAHVYCSFGGEAGSNLRSRHGMQIDIKASGGVVAAPPSLGRGGKVYAFRRGAWDAVPQLKPVPAHIARLLGARSSGGSDIPVGERNDRLFGRLMKDASACGSLEDLRDCAETHNSTCTTPLGLAEVERIVQSVWGYQARGENWAALGSYARVGRDEIKFLMDRPHALTLLTYLRAYHAIGHTFAVAVRPMAHMMGCRPQKVIESRDWLVHCGFIEFSHEAPPSKPGHRGAFFFRLHPPRAPFGKQIKLNTPPPGGSGEFL